MPIFITVQNKLQARDASEARVRMTAIEPGQYEMEEIDCPAGLSEGAEPIKWWVIKDSRIGMRVIDWEEWSDPDFGEYAVIIEKT